MNNFRAMEDGHLGTVHGAIATGWRAAREIVGNINKVN